MKKLLVKDFSIFLKEEARSIIFSGLNEHFSYSKSDNLWKKSYSSDENLPQMYNTEEMINIVALKIVDDIFNIGHNSVAGFEVRIMDYEVPTVRIIWYESVKKYNQSYLWHRFGGRELTFEIEGEIFKYIKNENDIWVLEGDKLPQIDFQGLIFQKEFDEYDFERMADKYQAYMILTDTKSLAILWNGKRFTKKDFKYIYEE